jgi:hypothetical protein
MVVALFRLHGLGHRHRLDRCRLHHHALYWLLHHHLLLLHGLLHHLALHRLLHQLALYGLLHHLALHGLLHHLTLHRHGLYGLHRHWPSHNLSRALSAAANRTDATGAASTHDDPNAQEKKPGDPYSSPIVMGCIADCLHPGAIIAASIAILLFHCSAISTVCIFRAIIISIHVISKQVEFWFVTFTIV